MNASSCSAAMANEGISAALTILFVIPVSAVTADGIVNLPGFTSVVNDDFGSPNVCAAISTMRDFSLLNPVVSRSNTMTVGNSEDARVTAAFPTGDVLSTIGSTALPRADIFVVNTDVAELDRSFFTGGGVHPRGALVASGVAGGFGTVADALVVVVVVDDAVCSTAGNAAATFCNKTFRRDGSSDPYNVESLTMRANIGDA
mmetsp:Transcript_137/g.569  ORF Transcript_137/g.569 Transcript_137/m.569 type:complete len:202 (+) Transcript_137:3058-3663(+)